jgi:uncharacterized protein
VREPGGGIVALARQARPVPTALQRTDAVWYQLNTIDVERAIDDYRTLFGWSFEPPVDAGEHGVFHPFSWERGGAPVGWMTDVFRRPGRHPHWLFYFPVPDVASAMATVRDQGGYATGPFALGRGASAAVCDDSQSAAFAVRYAARP